MPSRIIPFVNDQVYHVYNRGSEKRVVFDVNRDYKRFLKTLLYYQLEGPKPKLSHFFKYQGFKPESAKKIVEILTYCLMPNHFHLLIKQIRENGITECVSKLTNSYTKYYNTKYKRVGPLFQGEFKSVIIENDEQLVHVSRYIHLNPLVSYLVKSLPEYEWSSYREYVGNGGLGVCSTGDILSYFSSPDDYNNFLLDQVSYAQDLDSIKHKIIEDL